jgi:hypothetical protein
MSDSANSMKRPIADEQTELGVHRWCPGSTFSAVATFLRKLVEPDAASMYRLEIHVRGPQVSTAG